MIRVALSACLFGREVRWDGRHKLARSLCEALARDFELLPVCPEVELGLGVPRPPIQLVAGQAAPTLQVIESGRDLTAAMRQYAADRIEELEAAGIAGYVLKSRSPSCGLRGVPVVAAPGRDEIARAPGLFAEVLRARLPGLPCAEEKDLEDGAAMAAFAAEVKRYHSSLSR